jgi:DNA-binding transcriptional LysR family regulator
MKNSLNLPLKLEDLALFLAICEQSSISAAAKVLNIPKSTLSRRLRELEDDLEVRLLERSTRNLRLTEAGEQLRQRGQNILADIEETHQLLSKQQESPSGRLCIAAPSDFFGLHFQHVLTGFVSNYPDIELELYSGAGQLDMLKDRVDVLLHVDEPSDSSFIARPLTRCIANYVSSPGYLQRHGRPSHPRELEQHRCIIENPNPTAVVSRWTYREQGQIQELNIKPSHSSDSSSMCALLVRSGEGISLLPNFVCREWLDRGELVKLFEDSQQVSHHFYAIYASRRHVPTRVQVFLDYLSEQLPDQL